MAAVGMGKLGLGAAGVTAIVALMAGCASSSSATKTAAGSAAEQFIREPRLPPAGQPAV